MKNKNSLKSKFQNELTKNVDELIEENKDQLSKVKMLSDTWIAMVMEAMDFSEERLIGSSDEEEKKFLSKSREIQSLIWMYIEKEGEINNLSSQNLAMVKLLKKIEKLIVENEDDVENRKIIQKLLIEMRIKETANINQYIAKYLGVETSKKINKAVIRDPDRANLLKMLTIIAYEKQQEVEMVKKEFEETIKTEKDRKEMLLDKVLNESKK